jgi:hypothetical protein
MVFRNKKQAEEFIRQIKGVEYAKGGGVTFAGGGGLKKQIAIHKKLAELTGTKEYKYAVSVYVFSDDYETGYGYVHTYAKSKEDALENVSKMENPKIIDDNTQGNPASRIIMNTDDYTWEINYDDEENPYQQNGERFIFPESTD